MERFGTRMTPQESAALIELAKTFDGQEEVIKEVYELRGTKVTLVYNPIERIYITIGYGSDKSRRNYMKRMRRLRRKK